MGEPGVQGSTGERGVQGESILFTIDGSPPTPLQSQDPVNFVSGPGILVTNPNAGNVLFQANPSDFVTAVTTGQGSPPVDETGVITLQGGNNINIQDVPPGVFTIALNDPLLLPGNERITSYLRVGSLAVPTNTSPGDLTTTRLSVNSTLLFSPTTGEFLIVEGTLPESSGTVNGTVQTLTATSVTDPTPATLIGSLHSLTTAISTGISFTGRVVGDQASALHQGSADVVNLIGQFAQTQLAGNSFATSGLLTVMVTNGGSGYTVGDTLTLVGGSPPASGGTVTVVAVTSSPAGVILTVAIAHPGTGYVAGQTYATTGGSGTGAIITVLTTGTGTITNAIGLQAQGLNANGSFTTGGVLSAIGVQVLDSNPGSGPDRITTQVGFDIRAQTRGLLDCIGLRIFTPSGATNNFGLQFVAGTTPAAGITWGTDTNLYRSAASTLRTDTNLSALHFLCNSSTPVILAPGPGAGTGAIVSITGNDAGCQVTLTPGTAPASGAGGSQIFRVTFNTAYPSAVNAVIVSPANLTAAALTGTQQVWIGATATTSFDLFSGTTALSTGGSPPVQYVWNFSIRP